MAEWTRFMRASLLEVLSQDYIRTARAKGLAERVVLYKHALRNALIPIVTLVGLAIPGVLGGAVHHRDHLQLPRDGPGHL
jgi:peptide/nickel transport system permease protein